MTIQRVNPLRPVASFDPEEIGRDTERLEANLKQRHQADDLTKYGPFSITQLQTAAYAARPWQLVRCGAAMSVTLPRPDEPRAGNVIVRNDTNNPFVITVRSPARDCTVAGQASISFIGPRSQLEFRANRIAKDWMQEGSSETGGIRERVLDNKYLPVGNWGLHLESLADYSGNGNALTVETGQARYAYITPTLGGFMCDGDTRLFVAAFVAALALTGDMTFLYLVNLSALPAGAGTNTPTLGHAAAGAAVAANNDLYIHGVDNKNQILLYSETGLGVGTTYTVPSWVTRGQIALVGATRIGGVWQNYVNGRVFGPASSVITAPTVGTNGRFRVGGFPGAGAGLNFVGTMASVAVYSRGLTAAEMIERFNYSLGGAYGFISING